MRYYFHVMDGIPSLDSEGIEIADLAGVQQEAFFSGNDIFRSRKNPLFWTGEPWKMWVTSLTVQATPCCP